MRRSIGMRRPLLVTSRTIWRQTGNNWRIIFVITIVFLSVWGLLFAFALIQFGEVNKWTNKAGNEEYVNQHGMRVIVGRANAWNGKPNFSQAELDEVHYRPQPGAGEDGHPVDVPPEMSMIRKRLFVINGFNLMASDKISVNRTLPDFRSRPCQKKMYNSNLPDTSIIVVFHNEAWSTLLRTIHSIINKTPAHLLKEIILVDDDSKRAFLKKPLDDYVATLPASIIILHAEKRIGLVQARLRGAAISKGKVLTFLDAHIECMDGWIEPLLQEIATDRSRVVCPTIDVISDENFGILKSMENLIGGFNWNVHFRWYPMPSRVQSKRDDKIASPIETPVMAGGLFSIDKSYFEELGTYDEGMEIWGGENVEISLRIWLCGGSLYIVPCSHVGHVFRSVSPYMNSVPGGVGRVLFGNTIRAVEVWMDEFKDFFYFNNKEALRYIDNIDVRDRRNIRERLQCKNFTWYLENVWPEHSWPHNHHFFGRIVNKNNGRCIQKPPGQYNPHMIQSAGADLQNCIKLDHFPLQYFLYTNQGEIKTDDYNCLDASWGGVNTKVIITHCNDENTQKWKYEKETKRVIHIYSELCLDLPNAQVPDGLTIQTCSDSLQQKWIFQTVDWQRER